MKVSDILEITSPVYINHMIVLTTVDSSSLSYWLPLLLDAQYELHHLALVFLQLILDCHCASLDCKVTKPEGGTRLPGLKAFSGVRLDAYENRIPIHYIKGHTFWVGQEGCGYERQSRDEGKWNQHPVVVPHPQWELYQST